MRKETDTLPFPYTPPLKSDSPYVPVMSVISLLDGPTLLFVKPLSASKTVFVKEKLWIRIDNPLQQAACDYQPERLTCHIAQYT